MTKKELVGIISKEEDIPLYECERIITRFQKIVMDRLKMGDEVKMNGFGVFYINKFKERKAHDFKTGKTISIPSRDVFSFRFTKRNNHV